MEHLGIEKSIKNPEYFWTGTAPEASHPTANVMRRASHLEDLTRWCQNPVKKPQMASLGGVGGVGKVYFFLVEMVWLETKFKGIWWDVFFFGGGACCLEMRERNFQTNIWIMIWMSTPMLLYLGWDVPGAFGLGKWKHYFPKVQGCQCSSSRLRGLMKFWVWFWYWYVVVIQSSWLVNLPPLTYPPQK